MIYLFTVEILLVIIVIYLLIRSEQVNKFRNKLMYKVYKYSMQDVVFNGSQYDGWRWVALRRVSYNKMLFGFKRLKKENYWKDTSFLRR